MAGYKRSTVLGWAVALVLWGGGEGARSEADPYRIAQIRPDASLSTQVNGVCDGSGGSCNITNGATRGSNLFHSFLQFSLPNGDIANFQTTPAIQNVIVRVTGIGQAFVSNINGTIQTSNPANFFLLNPNGIIFSAGATLNIGGSFVATTAEKMVFQDGTMFGVHAPTPLLTVSVPIGLQLGQSPGAIQMQSSYLSSADTSNFGDFALVGGKVSLEGATLIDPGHRIELGGLAEPGVVGLNINGNSLSLSFPEGVERADVSLSPDTTNNSSSIDVTAGGGGSVAVHARNLTVSGGSSLVAGIGSGLGTPDSQAGDISLDATGIIDINQSSYIENDVYRNAIGNSGNIHVKTGSLSITSGADLGTFVLGQGKVGDVVIDAKDSITLEGTSPDGKSSSGLFSLVSQSATGQGGNISIMTGFLSLANSAVILDSTFGKGNAGSINIQAANDITLNNDAFIVSLVQSENAIGNGGNVTIGASSIFVQGGSQINAFTRGRGSAGNLTLQARDTVSFEGVGSNGVYSGALSTVQPEGIGNAGDLTIDTKRLVVRDGAEITATTFGKGNAGNLTVYASDSVELSGEEPSVNGQVNGRVSFPSGLFAQVDREGQGKAGSLTIETQRLNVSNGSKVQAATFGDGDAGNLLIRADEVNVSAAQPTFWNTAINAGVSVDPRTVSLPKGKGGNLTIETGRLSIQSTTAEGIKPVEVTVDTAGEGNAGTLLVQAHDLVEVVGENSFLSADVTRSAVGQGGDLNIETQRLSVRDGGQVSASTFPRTTGNAGNLVVRASDSVEVLNSGSIAVSSAGRGDAGSLTINTPAIRLDNQGKILAETRSGQGGNIILNVQDILLMRRNSQISTTAGTAQAGGDGGNITIDAPRGFLVTAPNENNDITANAFSGKGGNIRINGQGIYWFTPLTRSELRQRLDKINPSLPLDPTFLTTNDITASSNLGVSGTVTINILNFDPSRGLVQLPTGLADASRQITQRCSRSSQRLESSFYITGNSGLAERPGDPPISSFPTGDVQTIAANQPAPITQTPAPSPPPTSPLVEAQKWIRNTNGDIYLVANSPDAIVHLPIARPAFCP